MIIEIELPDEIVSDCNLIAAENNETGIQLIQNMILPRVFEQVRIYKMNLLENRFKTLPVAEQMSKLGITAPVQTASLAGRVKSFFGMGASSVG